MARKRRSAAGSAASVAKRRFTNTQRFVEELMVFDSETCLSWFRKYTTEQNDILGPDGMEQFCTDIGVDPEDIVMLVLAWKMNAKTLGYFTSAEWLKGLTELQCDSIIKLQRKLDILRSYLNDSLTFKTVYRYAYDFAKDENQRSMDIETAKSMLNLLLGKRWKLYASFTNFINQYKYKIINKDQWYNILEFSQTISLDFSNYDPNSAWPVMLDDFVGWSKDNNSQK